AAMLHDVIEDTGIPKTALAEQFGDTVTELVDGVSKLTHIHFEDKQQQQAENFQKMAMAMAKDIRVILVKLADRLHNLRTLGSLRPEKRRRIARETLEIYAPIANRLGLNTVRVEMEDLCFEAIHPMRSERIRRAVKSHRGRHAEIISQIATTIRSRLTEQNIPARVVGREKHLFSIYSKMKQSKKKDIDEIMDVYGFRIITDNVDACYRILGLMHGQFKPIPGRFKDYIVIPKANGYQSLHTTLFNAGDVPIEVQIRTEEMDAMANHGIAAHWLYKSENDLANGSQRARQWVQNLLELQRNAGSPLEFVEHVKVDLFPDEIYVFTPKGKILTLPAGSTAIDFAYSVHTDIGNQCIACRIDRQLSPVSSRLQSGQTVQIVTAPSARPNPDWLDFVASSKARSSIRNFLKHQRQSESIELGERLLDKALTNMSSALSEIEEETIQKVLTETARKSFNELLEEIGSGNRMAPLLARRMMELQLGETPNAPGENPLSLTIKGTEGLVVSYARCCSPIPGDPIMGHVSSGKGLVVHVSNCRNIEDIRENPEKCLPLSWDKEVTGEFIVNLKVIMENRRNLIIEVAGAVNQAEASTEKISVEEKDARLSEIHIKVQVKNRHHLARVLKRLRTLKGVSRIVRTRH
ncbi:MAG: RelA/SpoT family protein, partial [Oceanobacter sp.]